MRRSTFLIGYLVLLAFHCSASAQTLPVGQEPETVSVQSFLAEEWRALLDRDPVLALSLGLESERLWPDSSPETRNREQRLYFDLLAEIAERKRTALGAEDRLYLELFEEQVRWRYESLRLGLDAFRLDQRQGPHTLGLLSETQTFSTATDLERWVERLEALPDYLEGELSALEDAIERGMLHPKLIAERTARAVRAQAVLCEEPQQSPYLLPFRQAPLALKEDPKFEALQARARTAVQGPIAREYGQLADLLAGPYLEAAPSEVGLLRSDPSGESYRFLVRRYTTTEMTPEEIHQLGLTEVERIRGEMAEVQARVGFPGTLEEFFEHLRTDPRHYVRDPQELLKRYRAFCKRVDREMPRFFGRLPRMPYGVEPIPGDLAPSTSTAYYLPATERTAGVYSVNLYRPESRPLFEIPALSLHEAVPGHHHQIALALELEGLPEFLKYSTGFGDFTVFVEGWALYAEGLGREMGLYSDPYDQFGRLTYDMWRSIRLVVDTGIHHFGWSRERAIDYFLANSPRARLDVENEIDRYIAWPGQALSYKIGQLKISELRRQAEERLGDRFDLREFHDLVLSRGAVSLRQLQAQVEAWISEAELESSAADR